MNAQLRLGAFGLGLAAVFGAAFGAGRAVGPDAGPAPAAHGHTAPAAGATAGHAEGHDAGTGQGYAIARADAPAGQFAFRVTGPDGKAVTAYDVAHDKRLHLIVVRTDLSDFRHVHPELGADGTWRVASPLAGPGAYRAYADFKPQGGTGQVLALDVAEPGSHSARPLPAPATRTAVDGYEVRLAGALEPGRTSRLTLTVAKDGRPVTDLQPYLGAYGHLVALRQDDLAYLHVHPDGEPGDGRTAAGPGITFLAEVTRPGNYRLYLDFQHDGKVRTAEFTAKAGAAATSPAPGASPSGGDHDDHAH